MKTEQKWIIGDCLDLLPGIPDKSVSLIVTDPPYNVLQLEWDAIKINWELLASEFHRILKPKGSIYIFGQMPMIFEIYSSFIRYFKFKQDLVWYKNRGFCLCDTIFTKYHENILYFIKAINQRLIDFGKYIKEKRIQKGISLKQIGDLCNERWYHRGGHLYFETGLSLPSWTQYLKLKEVLDLDNRFDDLYDKATFNFEEIKTIGDRYTIEREGQKLYGVKSNMGKHVSINKGLRNPKTVLEYPVIQGGDEYYGHATQKPLKLIEYLVKASSNEGDLICDPFLGSGTTLEACMNTNRNCIGFEISNEWEPHYRKRLRSDNTKLDAY